jgi:Na+-driven multidrug efflux pump
MGARLEYIQQPVAFGFGTAIIAMVGTNWGAGRYRRAREIAWTGAATVALVCGTIGNEVACCCRAMRIDRLKQYTGARSVRS